MIFSLVSNVSLVVMSTALFGAQQVVRYFTSRGSCVHIACLDATKAFDKVLRDRLLSIIFSIVNVFHHMSRKTSRRDLEAPETLENLGSF